MKAVKVLKMRPQKIRNLLLKKPLRSSLRQHLLTSVSLLQTRRGTALQDMLNTIGAQQQRVKVRPSVTSLPSTTVLFALVNGLTDGMSRERMAPFPDHCKLWCPNVQSLLHLNSKVNGRVHFCYQ